MKNNLYGGIIKINRKQAEIKLEYISTCTGISKGQLSKIERNREYASHEQIEDIFNVLNLKKHNEDINGQFEKDFYTFYNNIAYARDYEQSYQKILSYENVIKTSLSYIKFLLSQMIYHINKNDLKTIKEYMYLEDYFEYLESYQIQLFYDYCGAYYINQHKYKSSLDYFETALSYKGIPLSKAMVQYHLATSLTYLNEVGEAFPYITEAIGIFSERLNLKRLTLSQQLLAIIYVKLGNYEKSEDINLSCLNAFTELNMPYQVIEIYNNLLWSYVLSENYQKIILKKDEILLKMKVSHSIYFYISYAYYKLGNLDEARIYIKLAKEHLNHPTDYMQSMIKTFAIYLSDAKIIRKEKYLLRVYDAAVKSQKEDLVIFTLNMIIDFYVETNQKEKEYEYMKLLLCYKI